MEGEKGMDKGRRARIALAASAAILGLMRIPAVGVNEAAMFAARAAMAAALCAACAPEGWLYPAVQAGGSALIAWIIDLTEGAMSWVYALAGLAMAWGYKKGGKGIGRQTFAAALAGCLVSALGMALALALGRGQMTLGSALLYALPQQLLPLLAYLAGGLAAGRLGWGPAAA